MPDNQDKNRKLKLSPDKAKFGYPPNRETRNLHGEEIFFFKELSTESARESLCKYNADETFQTMMDIGFIYLNLRPVYNLSQLLPFRGQGKLR